MVDALELRSLTGCYGSKVKLNFIIKNNMPVINSSWRLTSNLLLDLLLLLLWWGTLYKHGLLLLLAYKNGVLCCNNLQNQICRLVCEIKSYWRWNNWFIVSKISATCKYLKYLKIYLRMVWWCRPNLRQLSSIKLPG